MAGYEQQCASCGKYMEYSSRTSICWVCEAKREADEKKAAMEAEARAGEQQRAEAERSRRLDMFAAASEDGK